MNLMCETAKARFNAATQMAIVWGAVFTITCVVGIVAFAVFRMLDAPSKIAATPPFMAACTSTIYYDALYCDRGVVTRADGRSAWCLQ